MKWLDILERIQAGESQTTEFQRGPGDVSAAGKSICAFANTEGGVLILGVDDAQTIAGVNEDAEKAQERLTSFLHFGCSAPVSAQIGRHQDPKGWVHWIEVPRQRGFEPLRYGGRVWVRRGRSSVEPSPSELQELYNIFGYILTEQRTIQPANPRHIDLQGFREYLQAQGFETDEDPQPGAMDDLENRGVIAKLGGALRATLYGVLAFGKEPQMYPQTGAFRIECVAYEGDDRAGRVLQVADARGTIDEQVRRAVGWFRGLGRFESYRGITREDRALLPERALREALINAVVHRDYAVTGSKVLLEVFPDRVDVTSPGGLPNPVSVDSVRAGAHPRSRNESMAHYMVMKKFMEQRGRGWLAMRRAMREFNGTEPEIVAEPSHVRVTFRLDPILSDFAFQSGAWPGRFADAIRRSRNY